MDWYAWLCRAGLHPDVAFEYALLFARNELGAADVRHLDHEFLASMGVAVAKHRLEILKLARKDSSSSAAAGKAVAAAITALPWRATRLLAAAAHRSARSALGRLRASLSPRGRGRDRDRAAAAGLLLAAPRVPLPPRHRGGGRVAHSWSRIVAASPVAIRGAGKQAVLAHVSVGRPVLLTSSCASRWAGSGATVKALPAPAAAIAGCLAAADTEACSCDDEEELMMGGGGGDEDMRWEAMFQDLKPT